MLKRHPVSLSFITKWGNFITKWGSFFYYKVGQNLLQSGAGFLLQSRAVITKWGNYYKVGHNNSIV